MRLLSIDPGIRGCGIAMFEYGELALAGYVENPVKKGNGVSEVVALSSAVVSWVHRSAFTWGGIADAAFEVPRVYPAARQKGDQNDLIAIAGVAFAIGARALARCTTYYPRDWKGTVDADEVMIPRIKSRLSAVEKRRILPVRESLMHNVYDAIGIGLKKLGRLEPVRIIARGK